MIKWINQNRLTITRVVVAMAVLAFIVCVLVFRGSSPPKQVAPGPVKGTAPTTTLHYTGNGNFNGSTYSPGAYGFNMADVASQAQAAALTGGVKALVFVGDAQGGCTGASSTFTSFIQSFVVGGVPDPNVWGFYLEDEPYPNTGTVNTNCAPANFTAETAYVHSVDASWYTFIIEQDLAQAQNPNYWGGYGPTNGNVDYYGLDPYPCHYEFGSPPFDCNYNVPALAVAQAESTTSCGISYYSQVEGCDPGIPLARIVPVYQTFGCWPDSAGNATGYETPTADQMTRILAAWSAVVPTPVFDYAYSWGVQPDTDYPAAGNDCALSEFNGTNGYPNILAVMLTHNTNNSAAATAPTSETFTKGANGDCTLSWAAPTSNGGTSVTGYSVLASDSAGGYSTLTVISPNTTFRGSSGETFTAQVAAVTDSGNTTGPYAPLLTCTQ